MLAKYKNIIIVVVIVIIGFIVYTIFKPDPEAISLLKASGPTEVSVLGEDIINALNQLNTLNLDPSILDDPVVNSLTDHSRTLEEESIRKNNPFGPFGVNTGLENNTEENVEENVDENVDGNVNENVDENVDEAPGFTL